MADRFRAYFADYLEDPECVAAFREQREAEVRLRAADKRVDDACTAVARRRFAAAQEGSRCE